MADAPDLLAGRRRNPFDGHFEDAPMKRETAEAFETVAASKFTEAVTSVAFNLTLSRGMIAALDWLRTGKPNDGVDMFRMTSLKSLEYRGLVHWVVTEDGTNCGCTLTQAGRITCDLLVVAGLLSRIPAGKPRKKVRGG